APLPVRRLQANHLRPPAGVGAARLAEPVDQGGGGAPRLALPTAAVVGGEAPGAALGEAGERPLDGPHGQAEGGGRRLGVSVLTPAGKKAAGAGEPGRP